MRQDEQVSNSTVSWLFVLFWTFVFSICTYDFLVVSENPVAGTIDKISVHSGRGSHANILLTTGNDYEVDQLTINTLHVGDVVKVQQSSIFHRTLTVIGKNYSLSTALIANNILFFAILIISGLGSVGGFLLLIVKKLLHN